jgi:hypothetical protein
MIAGGEKISHECMHVDKVNEIPLKTQQKKQKTTRNIDI